MQHHSIADVSCVILQCLDETRRSRSGAFRLKMIGERFAQIDVLPFSNRPRWVPR